MQTSQHTHEHTHTLHTHAETHTRISYNTHTCYAHTYATVALVATSSYHRARMRTALNKREQGHHARTTAQSRIARTGTTQDIPTLSSTPTWISQSFHQSTWSFTTAPLRANPWVWALTGGPQRTSSGRRPERASSSA